MTYTVARDKALVSSEVKNDDKISWLKRIEQKRGKLCDDWVFKTLDILNPCQAYAYFVDAVKEKNEIVFYKPCWFEYVKSKHFESLKKLFGNDLVLVLVDNTGKKTKDTTAYGSYKYINYNGIIKRIK